MCKMANNKYEVIGTFLLAASFLSYTGPFTPEFRDRMLFDDWLPDLRSRSIPISDVENIIDVLHGMGDRMK